MRVVLVRPNHVTHLVSPPLGLAYLSAVLRAAGHECHVLDGLVLRRDTEGLARAVLGYAPDLVGITCLTAFAPQAFALSLRLQQAGLSVVLGGVHPTMLPRQTLDEAGCAFVVRGEGEVALPRLLEQELDPEGIAGVYTPDSLPTSSQDWKLAETVEELDSLPFPDWERVQLRHYQLAPHGGLVRAVPLAPVMSSRGCPYACRFCASPGFYGRRIRFRSPAAVEAEVRWLQRAHGVRELHFEDDNLTLRRDHAEELCSRLAALPGRLVFACPNGIRADRVDRPLARSLAEAGCYRAGLGIETADPTLLASIGKGESLEAISTAIEALDEAGILAQGFFVFGLPGETRETLERSIDYACASRLSIAQFLILDILPGSALWDELAGSFTPDWHKGSFREPEWLPEGLTRKDLQEAQKRAFLRFFLSKPSRLLALGKMVRPRQAGVILQRLRDFRILPGLR